MRELLAIFASSFVIAFSGALMPGPLLSTTISESGKHGWKVGPLFILGHAILEIVLIAGLFLGLAPLLTSNVSFIVIAFAGGGFMVWMAWGMFRSLPTLTLSQAAIPAGTNDPGAAEPDRDNGPATPAARTGPLALTGALMSLANPYWIIWWATIGLGLVVSSRVLGFAGIAAFFSGHILADLVWYSLVSVAVDRGRRVVSDRMYKILIAFCAAFLVGYATRLIVGGVIRVA